MLIQMAGLRKKEAYVSPNSIPLRREKLEYILTIGSRVSRALKIAKAIRKRMT
jgi:hypothetical protein